MLVQTESTNKDTENCFIDITFNVGYMFPFKKRWAKQINSIYINKKINDGDIISVSRCKTKFGSIIKTIWKKKMSIDNNSYLA